MGAGHMLLFTVAILLISRLSLVEGTSSDLVDALGLSGTTLTQQNIVDLFAAGSDDATTVGGLSEIVSRIGTAHVVDMAKWSTIERTDLAADIGTELTTAVPHSASSLAIAIVGQLDVNSDQHEAVAKACMQVLSGLSTNPVTPSPGVVPTAVAAEYGYTQHQMLAAVRSFSSDSVAATVDASGGEISVSSGDVTVTIPAGAFSQSVTVTVYHYLDCSYASSMWRTGSCVSIVGDTTVAAELTVKFPAAPRATVCSISSDEASDDWLTSGSAACVIDGTSTTSFTGATLGVISTKAPPERRRIFRDANPEPVGPIAFFRDAVKRTTMTISPTRALQDWSLGQHVPFYGGIAVNGEEDRAYWTTGAGVRTSLGGGPPVEVLEALTRLEFWGYNLDAVVDVTLGPWECTIAEQSFTRLACLTGSGTAASTDLAIGDIQMSTDRIRSRSLTLSPFPDVPLSEGVKFAIVSSFTTSAAQSQSRLHALALDPVSNALYVSDLITAAVYRMTPTPYAVNIVSVASGNGVATCVTGIAVDSVNERLYFVEATFGRVFVLPVAGYRAAEAVANAVGLPQAGLGLLGKLEVVEVVSGLAQPSALAVDATAARPLLYIGEATGRVLTAAADGSNLQLNPRKPVELTRVIMQRPSRARIGSLAVDGDRIFWTEANTNQVWSSDLHGGRATALSDELPVKPLWPRGVAVGGDQVYWTEYLGMAWRSNRDGSMMEQLDDDVTVTARKIEAAVATYPDAYAFAMHV